MGRVPEELRSERLVLRAPHVELAPELNTAVRESLPELKPWMEWAQEEPSLAESVEHAVRARRAFLADEDFQLVMCLGDRIVGSSGFHHVDWSVPKFEIGYWVRSSDTGRGYATEAVRCIERFLFDALRARRIEIRCHTANVRSRAVPERLGFELEGVLRNDCIHTDGRLRDTAVYAKIG